MGRLPEDMLDILCGGPEHDEGDPAWDSLADYVDERVAQEREQPPPPSLPEDPRRAESDFERATARLIRRASP